MTKYTLNHTNSMVYSFASHQSVGHNTEILIVACFTLIEFHSGFQDDENHDPQWSYEQLVDAKLEIGGHVIGPDVIAIMEKTTLCVFEILEHAWASMNCSLIDMKVEFGIDKETGELGLGACCY
jgi:hypothetical protein